MRPRIWLDSRMGSSVSLAAVFAWSAGVPTRKMLMLTLRIATFNLENFDNTPQQLPTLDERIALMRPQLLRINADILCLQEVHGQELAGQPRALLALDQLLVGTQYAEYFRVSTKTADGTQVYDERNLVILSRFPITAHRQIEHDPTFGALTPLYRKVTAVPAETDAKEVTWERPLLYATIRVTAQHTLHLINLHLKSRIPSTIRGQKFGFDAWRSASGWAEGFFLSSMKRVGQALETRLLIDAIFDTAANALLAVCGDFNAEVDEVPLEAIRGSVEQTNNTKLSGRVMIPCELTIPASLRYSFLHFGQGRMLDHLLVSRALFACFRQAEVHNELLHDESSSGASDKKFPESDHAPVVVEFALPEPIET